jgi:hypothetical protein
MTVVVILGVVGVLAIRMGSKSRRGEAAPEFARALLGLTQQSRQTASALLQKTRLLVQPASSGPNATEVVAQVRNSAGNWITLGALVAPTGLEMCAVDQGVTLTAATPTCPLAATATIDFGACGSYLACVSGTASNGATLYFHSQDNDKKYKLMIFGLTGMPKLVDTW